jgi:hypothetical protein
MAMVLCVLATFWLVTMHVHTKRPIPPLVTVPLRILSSAVPRTTAAASSEVASKLQTTSEPTTQKIARSTIADRVNTAAPLASVRHLCPGVILDHQDAQVRDHPGGTEAEALQERRTIMDSNWPPHFPATWRARPRPQVPVDLSCAQASSSSWNQTACKTFDCRFEELPPSSATASCASMYDLPTIQKLRESETAFCSDGRSDISCMQTRLHPSHNVDYSVCRGRHVGIVFDRIGDGDFPWLAFEKGALQAACRVPESARSKWNFIHCLNDWMGLGFEESSHINCDVTVTEPTLFLTRSGDYSPFALAHDWTNTVMQFAARRLDPSTTRLVIMDRMTVGFYSPVWQQLFSTGHQVEWFVDLRQRHAGKTVCYAEAHFNVPARLSPLYNEDECRGSTWLRVVSNSVLEAVGALSTVPLHTAFVITVIIRKNYGTGHPIGRRIENTHELVDALRRLKGTVVSAIDYAEFDFDQQMNVTRATDLLVGMHGAGLIQAMFLPQHGGVFEFFCPDRPSSNIRYRELSKRMKLRYDSYSLENGYSVPISQVVPQIERFIATIAEAKSKIV